MTFFGFLVVGVYFLGKVSHGFRPRFSRELSESAFRKTRIRPRC